MCEAQTGSGGHARGRKALASPAEGRERVLCGAACGTFTERKV